MSFDLAFEHSLQSRVRSCPTSFKDGLRASVSHLPILTDSIILILVLFSLAEQKAIKDKGKNCAKITKKQSKPGKIEHEIAKNAQKPDQRTFSVQFNKAKALQKPKYKYKDGFNKFLNLHLQKDFIQRWSSGVSEPFANTHRLHHPDLGSFFTC
nr:hypothetical protein [Tanacetum cinerariifolium]